VALQVPVHVYLVSLVAVLKRKHKVLLLVNGKCDGPALLTTRRRSPTTPRRDKHTVPLVRMYVYLHGDYVLVPFTTCTVYILYVCARNMHDCRASLVGLFVYTYAHKCVAK
jgi:hypothetical protein